MLSRTFGLLLVACLVTSSVWASNDPDTFTFGPGQVDTIVADGRDRKSTRLNSSHGYISYAVFCLKQQRQAAHGGRVSGCPRWGICTAGSAPPVATGPTRGRGHGVRGDRRGRGAHPAPPRAQRARC